ncbi:uncharacterized protein DUF3305 [Tepidimonas ignava]|uniref:Uncharacterized protein DUF3305 n=1 Tax=Tepidimonas ignava TaxID=114249 RepID=A0A4R3L995_9BURK|nr:uncharacterized protein DUF3305 [Tepidimonas ignava]TSE23594.1 hypothetical protein Tigna_00288 [Tepidimonas ignava]
MSQGVQAHPHNVADGQPPTLRVGVVMRREPVSGPMARWQPWRWALADVQVLQAPPGIACTPWPAEWQTGAAVPLEPEAGAAPGVQHWGYAPLNVALHPQDAEGYLLNVTAPAPCFWVLWREPETDDGLAQPLIVTLSYHDAGRWLDAQERVDQVAAPVALVRWLADYAQRHHQPEPKRRARPASFRPLTDRFGQPARISTGTPRGAAGGGAG